MTSITENAAPASFKGAFMVTAAACLWGCFSIFLRPAERIVAENGGQLSAATESFIFFLVVFLMLGPLCIKKRVLTRPTRNAWLWLLAFSVFDALNLLCYFGAMQKSTLAVAVLTHYLSPVFVALLSPWVLAEKSPKGIWVATVGAVVGLTLLVEPMSLLRAASASDTHINARASSGPLGALLGVTSAVLFAVSVFSVKKLGAWFTSNQILVFHYPIALLILFAFVPVNELSMGLYPLLLLVSAGIVCGTLGGFLFVEGVRHLAASRAGILTLIEPVVAVTIGVVVWSEHPSWIAWCGAAIILVSAYRVIRAKA